MAGCPSNERRGMSNVNLFQLYGAARAVFQPPADTNLGVAFAIPKLYD